MSKGLSFPEGMSFLGPGDGHRLKAGSQHSALGGQEPMLGSG